MHAVRTSFESDDNEGMLLVDASNAFNSLNRQVEYSKTCPPLVIILINNYRAPTAELFVDGDTLLSQEGTTQGDPLAMPCTPYYSSGNYKQIWYADDAAAVGKITELREWWDKLTTAGPGYAWLLSKSIEDMVRRTATLHRHRC